MIKQFTIIEKDLYSNPLNLELKKNLGLNLLLSFSNSINGFARVID